MPARMSAHARAALSKGIVVTSVVVARQPILDRKRRTFAYELLYRPTDGVEEADGDLATSTVMSNARKRPTEHTFPCG